MQHAMTFNSFVLFTNTDGDHNMQCLWLPKNITSQVRTFTNHFASDTVFQIL